MVCLLGAATTRTSPEQPIWGLGPEGLRRACRSPGLGGTRPASIDQPVAGRRPAPIDAATTEYLTAEQVAALADAAAIPPHERLTEAYAQYRLAVLVLAYCGLRWSELAALKVGAIDLMRRRITVSEAMTEVNGGRIEWGTPKNHERRSVPLPRFPADELTPHLAGRDTSDLVFTSTRGEVLRNRNARRVWFDNATAAIGQPGLTPHELRHTAASLAVSRPVRTSRQCSGCSGMRRQR